MKVIIPAAGLGTRMLPFTKDVSKAMIMVNGKPFLSYIIDELKKINEYKKISEIYIIENSNKSDITNFIFKTTKMYAGGFYNKIKVLKQHKPNGPLGAIFETFKYLSGKNDVLIWLGDTLLDTSKKKFDFTKSFVTVSDVENTESWCMINAKNFIKDKQDFVNYSSKDSKYFALNGVYFIKGLNLGVKGKIDLMCNTQKIHNEYQISSLLKYVIKNNNKFRLEKLFEWYDIGNYENYKKTKNYIIKLKARGSNDISFSYDDVFIIKRGRNENAILKILREKKWYDDAVKVNPSFCGVIPKSFLTNNNSLYMTNEKGDLLSDLMLYDTNNSVTWKFIIRQLVETYTTYFYRPLDTDDFKNDFDKANDELFIKNFEKRIFKELPFELTKEQHLYINNKLKELYIDKIFHNRKLLTKIMHGDLHLGNILFDVSTMRFVFIDPRAMFGSDINRFKYHSYGNVIYDIAKLCHDFFGCYMFLNLEMLPTKEQEDFLDELGTYMIDLFKVHLNCLKDFTLEDFKFLGRLFVLNVIPIHFKESKSKGQLMFNYIIEKI